MPTIKELIKEVERLKKLMKSKCQCSLCYVNNTKLEGIKQTVEAVDKIYLDYQCNLAFLYAQTNLLKAQKKGETMAICKLRDSKDWKKLKKSLHIK